MTISDNELQSIVAKNMALIGIQRGRERGSLKKICKDMGIDYIDVNNYKEV